MNRYVFLFTVLSLSVGCLKTRAELEAESTGQTQERQTIAQQRPVPIAPKAAAGQAAPVKEKAPPSAYRFEEIDEQLRAITGRIDGVENSIEQLKPGKQAEKEGGSKDKQAMEQKFQANEKPLKKSKAKAPPLNVEMHN